MACTSAAGPLLTTWRELVIQVGAYEPYVREWLEQQAATGLMVVEAGAEAEGRRHGPRRRVDVLVEGGGISDLQVGVA